jgi:hypothetical protein
MSNDSAKLYRNLVNCLSKIDESPETRLTFYQIGMDGRPPRGPLFDTEAEAAREIKFLKQDDMRYADEAMREAGIEVPPHKYEIHKVQR